MPTNATLRLVLGPLTSRTTGTGAPIPKFTCAELCGPPIRETCLSCIGLLQFSFDGILTLQIFCSAELHISVGGGSCASRSSTATTGLICVADAMLIRRGQLTLKTATRPELLRLTTTKRLNYENTMLMYVVHAMLIRTPTTMCKIHKTLAWKYCSDMSIVS